MKKEPIRMCIVCRNKFNKKKLNRFVLIGDKFILDLKQKMPGRGFYICNKDECLQLANRKLQILKIRAKHKRQEEGV